MLKPTLRNILLYLFLKYIVFCAFIMIKNNNLRLLQIKTISDLGNSILYFLLMIMPLILLNMVLFSAPIYFSFKLKNIIHFTLIIISFLVAEYFLYTYLTSQNSFINGVYNGIISVLFLFLFFFKEIRMLLMDGNSKI